MKIEKNVPMPFTAKAGGKGTAWSEFLSAIKALEVNDSFYTKHFPSNYRLALSIVHHLMGRQFMSRKDGKGGFRIWRVQ